MPYTVAVAAGMIRPKKGNEQFRRAHRYLNYGLLGIASLMKARPPVFHGNFTNPSEFVADNKQVRDADQLLISVPSFYAVPWAQQVVELLNATHAKKRIHLGGRWVIDHNYQLIRGTFPSNVEIHTGLGESAVALFADATETVECPRLGPSAPPRLNYSLLQNHEQFSPSIEVSRGCGLGCAFCEDAGVALSRLTSPERIIREMAEISEIYDREVTFYLEASNFAPSAAWVDAFERVIDRNGKTYPWRAESRADILNTKKIFSLARSGLAILDIGLESASPQQLLKMRKTREPDEYLRKARALLRACKEAGVRTKVNILLYAGETRETLDETRRFLRDNRECIFGVSVYPVVAYGTGDRLSYYRRLYCAAGATGLEPTDIGGVWEVGLSHEVPIDTARRLSIELAQEFMPREHYFQLKAQSYLDPSYTWDQFCLDSDSIPAADRPFG